MPRQVNHDERRDQLTQALVGIVAARGLDEVSIREVAAAAGVSVGTVQHYFPTKDQMLLAAAEHSFGAGLRRAAQVSTAGAVREVLPRVLLEFLPLDAQRMAECRVWVAFAARAAVSPAIAAAQVEVLDDARTALAELLAEALASGEAAAGLDPVVEATIMLAVLDGLTLHAVQDPVGHPPVVQEAALRRHLDRLFQAV